MRSARRSWRLPPSAQRAGLNVAQDNGLGCDGNAPLGLSEATAAQKHVRGCRKAPSSAQCSVATDTVPSGLNGVSPQPQGIHHQTELWPRRRLCQPIPE